MLEIGKKTTTFHSLPRTILEIGPKPVLSTVSAHYYSPVIVVFTILK
jgi:hypothetical protein